MKKVFLVFLVSLCFGIITVVLWTGPAYAPPPGCSPVAQNLSMCNANLNTCNDNLGTCNANLGSCPTELSTCSDKLAECEAACEADCQIFPGDGYTDPSFGTNGHGPALSYTNNSDGTFTDNNTGYMWEIKLAADGTVRGETAMRLSRQTEACIA